MRVIVGNHIPKYFAIIQMDFIYKDLFGNVFITYDETAQKDFNYWYHLIDDNKNNNQRKGILLLGFPKTLMSAFRKIYGKRELIYMITDKAKTLYLLINGSNCPQFCNCGVLAAGMTVIIRFNGKWFAILIKDKTKPVSTVPGGIGTPFEHSLDPNFFITVAKRETYEETIGKINTALEKFLKETAGFIEIDGEKVYCPGLKIGESQEIKEIAYTFMMSTYYKIQVPDQYRCFSHYIDMDSQKIQSCFLNLLFDPVHALSNGNYQMNFIDNNEIDFVYAIQLQDDIIPEPANFGEVMEKINLQVNSIIMDSGKISKLHMFFHYLHMKRILRPDSKFVPTELFDRKEFANYNLPPALREIRFEC